MARPLLLIATLALLGLGPATAYAQTCPDADGDGYADSACGGTDCNDAKPSVHPGAAEVCDGFDTNCDGVQWATDHDNDGDGFAVCAGDCDDSKAAVHPGAPEVCDGLDNDCNGNVPANERDVDKDGTGVCGGDCNDFDAAIYPGSVEVCGDHKDNNCDGLTDDGSCVCPDLDGDTYLDHGCGGTDCDDHDSLVHPGAGEVCTDGIDNDCDGLIDRADPDATDCPVCTDADGDGYATEGGGCGAVDCADNNPAVHPGAVEVCDGLDTNCDGVVGATDHDGDGDGVALCAGDCNDADPAVHPGAAELCNGVDDDCNGILPASERDGDGDGVRECDTPPDCNDTNATVYPGNVEVCADGLDNNCDGGVDEVGCTCPDGDGDGHLLAACGGDDCNDANATVYPGSPEVCADGLDNDCNGSSDCGDAACGATAACQACAAADLDHDGYATSGGVCGLIDCDDADAAVHPGATEVCDGKDTNCDGVVGATDHDGDGDGVALCAGDCNDADAAVHPGATELCNGVDDDCNGILPASERDPDGDGVRSCDSPPDCNDHDNTAYPGAPELCLDGVDNNCDGVLDETSCICPDADADAHTTCEGDCDDHNPTTFPGAPEICNDGLDNDCDGLIDLADEADCLSGCIDGDLDGYKDATCGGTDCNDGNPLVNPGMTEICDGLDNNCDGVTAPTDVDADHDGVAICAGDCDDTNPAVYPGNIEVCTDGLDNDCNSMIDAADGRCAPPTCSTKTTPRDPPHLGTLLSPDDTVHPDNAALRCGKCHGSLNGPQDGVPDARFLCQRCHADSTNPSDPENGILKVQYPLPWPYGFGSAPNVQTHASTVLGEKYGTWGMHCITCHNPHQQEQNRAFGTSYGKLVKEYICFDNAATGEHHESFVEFTNAAGPGSFADGPPHLENICETCHTRTHHHRRTGDAPSDLDGAGRYVGHHDSQSCITCHHHSDGFKPTGGEPQAPHNTPFFLDNCQFCHAPDSSGNVNFATPIPNAECKKCHGLRDAHSSDPAQNPFASGHYTYDFKCIDCHDPMFKVGNNRKLLREFNSGSVLQGTKVVNTSRSGPGSLADGAPHEANICETCHSLTNHHRYDGMAPGDFDASGSYAGHHDGAYCMICHDHNRGFMRPGPSAEQ